MSYPFFRQQTDWDCSLACLFMLAHHFHRLNIDYFQFIKNNNYFQDLNLNQMQTTANRLGVYLCAYFVKWNDFIQQPIKNPLICQIKKAERLHFVVVYQKTKSHLLIADPQKNNPEWWTLKRFCQVYTGIVLTSEKSIYLPKNNHFHQQNNLVFWNKLIFELMISFLISVLTTGFVILNQFLVKLIIDEVLIKQIPSMLMTILLGFSLLFITKLILRLLLEIVLDKIEISFKKSWNLKFFSQVSQLTFTNYRKYKTHLLLQNYRYFNEILHFYFPTTFYIFENCFLAVVSLMILMIVDVTIVLPTFFLIAVSLVAYFLLWPWLKKMNQQQIHLDQEFNQQLLNYFHHYSDYKNRNRMWIPLNQLQNKLNEQVVVAKRTNTLTNIQTMINQTFVFFTNVVIIYFLLHTNSVNLIKPGSFVFIFALINNLVSKSSLFFQHFVHWNKLKEPKKQVNAFLFGKTNFIQNNPNNSLFQQIEKLQLQEVNYSYNQIDQLWKHNLNLTIARQLVIYGCSGVGKTTLLEILAHNLDSYRGKVLINNKFLSQQYYGHGWDQVYLLKPGAMIFPDTLLNNILTFDQKKDFLAIWKRAEIDYFCQKINLYPNTWISEQTISTGQRQVVNFLGLFFRNEPILLLDESLNSVDEQLKAELLKKILAIRKDAFVIYTTHDPKISSLFAQRLDLFPNDDED